jgi:predicted metal-dependent hydrolase
MAIGWPIKKKKRIARATTRQALLEIGERTVEVNLRANPRARRYIVKVDPTTGEVSVTAPSARSLSDALDFAKKERDWIAEMLANVPTPVGIGFGSPILYRGVQHILLPAEPEDGKTRRGAVWVDDTAAHSTIRVTGQPAHVPRRVRDWLKAEARRHIGERVVQYATQLDVQPKRVSVRDTTSRWGSCSSHNYLSFSWRLIMAPPHVLDYVVAHEVAHLRELNHGPIFWSHVEELVPHTKRSQIWLEEHGSALYRYAPRARKTQAPL